MKPLPLPIRITDAMLAIDNDVIELYDASDLRGVRMHQMHLTQLLGELAPIMKVARKQELGFHAVRRWKQAEKLLEKKTTGITVKEAEEESRIEVKAQYKQEINADANYEGLRILYQALLQKISFIQDVANDIKHNKRTFISHPDYA